MIVEWLMGVSAGFLGWMGDLFPPVDVPEWLEDPFLGMQPVVEAAIGWGVWVNVPFMLVIAVGLVGFYAVTFTVRLVRAVVGHFPVIGGNG